MVALLIVFSSRTQRVQRNAPRLRSAGCSLPLPRLCETCTIDDSANEPVMSWVLRGEECRRLGTPVARPVAGDQPVRRARRQSCEVDRRVVATSQGMGVVRVVETTGTAVDCVADLAGRGNPKVDAVGAADAAPPGAASPLFYAPREPPPMVELRQARSGPDQERRPRRLPALRLVLRAATLAALLLAGGGAFAQVAPSPSDTAAYRGLFAAASQGDGGEIAKLAAAGGDVNARDALRPHAAARRGVRAQARRDAGAGQGRAPTRTLLESDRYDIVTIAAVADDVATLRSRARARRQAPTNVTSRYDGTALIAAAHLGHDEVVRTLIRAGAPLDHVNNLGWTALIESIVLGDGGPRHIADAFRAGRRRRQRESRRPQRHDAAASGAGTRLPRNGGDPRACRRALTQGRQRLRRQLLQVRLQPDWISGNAFACARLRERSA